MRDSAHSNYIESVTQQWRKLVPRILSTRYRYCEFYGTRSCAHVQKTIPLAPIRLFTRQILLVPSLYQEYLA